jgi:hypothetical protein
MNKDNLVISSISNLPIKGLNHSELKNASLCLNSQYDAATLLNYINTIVNSSEIIKLEPSSIIITSKGIKDLINSCIALAIFYEFKKAKITKSNQLCKEIASLKIELEKRTLLSQEQVKNTELNHH